MKDSAFYKWLLNVNNQELVFDIVLLCCPMILVGPGKGWVAALSVILFAIGIALSISFWFFRKQKIKSHETSPEPSDYEDGTAGDVAKKYKHPVGNIGCMHCGATCHGMLQPFCQMCGNPYWPNIKIEKDESSLS